jgi:hypothetical protein
MSGIVISNHGRQDNSFALVISTPALGTLFALFLLLPALPGRGQTIVGSQPSPAAPVAHLQYREVDFAPLAWEVGVESTARFSKEPVYSGPGVFRGVLRLGSDTNAFVPFSWDERQQRLYVDLNRNRDLTDDPAGIFTAADRGLQLFRGIPLQFVSPQGPYQVKVDAHVFGQGGQGGAVRVFLYVRSLWDGAIELNGKKWYVAIIDRPDGRIGPALGAKEISDRMVLRPWAERDRPFLWWHASLAHMHDLSHVKLVTFPYRYAGNAEVFDAFNLPSNLFLEGQAYRMDCRVERAGAQAGLALSFQRFQPPLGKLQLGGDFIQRIVLDGGGAPEGITALLDGPAADVEVPLGVYARQLVLLHRPGGTNFAVGLGTNRLAVTATNEAHLDAGGPLRNTVEIASASGGTISLQYRLANAGNLGFHLAIHNEKAPPQLTIRQADAVVGRGQFEFG